MFAPLFYGYWEHIKRELESQGFDVSFITYRTNKILDGIIDLSGHKIKGIGYDNFVEKRICRLKGKFDYLLVIKGEFFSLKNLNLIKEMNPEIKTIMYQWDSVKNHNYIDLANGFDKVYTFDSTDALKYGFEYLPLFYTNDLIETKKKFTGKEDIDLLLVGIYNKPRYEYLQRIKRLSNYLNIYTHLVVPPGLYVRQELFTHKLGLTNCNDFKFSSISHKQLLELYCRSKVFVDICENQSGMSMRTIEAYGMNKKLLTNNIDIIKKDPDLGELEILDIYTNDEKIIEFTKENTRRYDNIDKFNLTSWCNKLLGLN